ncbi:MAG TPA: alpha-amylase family glycosyl hydrolase [Roseiflexaceae bacterium]|nr:alpha-amylase family glycosyl hydrolase [Roseiflexaceae bacterium]
MDEHTWWQRGVIYQIYPRSFQDTTGNGVGDLPGIIERLDYLRWLGVDAIWISPIYPSPMADFGYDVADYCDIDPLFGTLADFDLLVDEAHRRDIRVILDYVPNHSSDQHPWFQESRATRYNPKRDWYIWRDPAPEGQPPNNWRSVFGGSSWTLDEHTGQYYYHAYLKEQPDLNWRSPGVQHAMLDVLRFWLDRGVDGFRIDALRQLIKDEQWRDNPPNPDYQPGLNPYHALIPRHTTDLPEIMALIAKMRAVSDQYDERVLIGELYLSIERLVTYYGATGEGVQLPFNFHLILTPWRAGPIAELIRLYEAALPPGAWPNWVLGNHDQPRLASRVGPQQAPVAALLLLTLRGTPTLYYGDELGMRDVAIPPDLVQDPQEKNVPGLGLGRDPERTPMQWSGDPHAGFSVAEPWLPVAGDYEMVNVAVQREDPDSLLSLYRRLIALRRATPALAVGTCVEVVGQDDLLTYVREHGAQRMLVVLNMGSQPQTVELGGRSGRVVLATQRAREGQAVAGALDLGGDEGLVLELAG